MAMNQTSRSRAHWLTHSVDARAYAPHLLSPGARRGHVARIDYLLGFRSPVAAYTYHAPAPKPARVSTARVDARADARHVQRFSGPTGYLPVHGLLAPR
jgi:hypothetical protein